MHIAELEREPGAGRLPVAFWWALASTVPMVVGAFGPWETFLDAIEIRGTDDGVGWKVVGAATVAAVVLVVFIRWRRRWLCVVPLLAGGLGVAITAYNLHDILSFGASEVDRAEWGIYLALVGSSSLVLASVDLAAQARGAGAPDGVPIPDSHGTAKLRRPWAVFVLAILTFGLYGLYWYYQANRELRDYGFGRRPLVSLLAQVPGVLLIVPPFVSWWRFYSRIREAEARAGVSDRIDHTLGLALYVVAFFVLPFELVYTQRHLNALWRSERLSADDLPRLESYAPEPRFAPEA